MAEILVVAEMPFDGVDAGDKAVNQFTFHKEGAYAGGEATELLEWVRQFYAVATVTTTVSLSVYLGHLLNHDANACTLKAYDITGKLGNRGPDPVTGKERGPAPHGSPVALATMTLDPPGEDNDLPPQVAAALTLRARNALAFPVEAPDAGDAGAAIDRPRARRTGKLFFGPLNFAAHEHTVADVPARIADDFRTTALEAAERLQDQVGTMDYAWCVWSRQNDAVSVIERVEMDDSFDVIRRRKISATVRQSRVFAPVPDLALGA